MPIQQLFFSVAMFVSITIPSVADDAHNVNHLEWLTTLLVKLIFYRDPMKGKFRFLNFLTLSSDGNGSLSSTSLFKRPCFSRPLSWKFPFLFFAHFLFFKVHCLSQHNKFKCANNENLEA